jgi:hypothetical protein
MIISNIYLRELNGEEMELLKKKYIKKSNHMGCRK